jgi:SAM-dependent methyltransferase
MASLDNVQDFWNRGSCGEIYCGDKEGREKYAQVSEVRYALEPYLAPFARFEEAAGKDVLEVGVGMGSDHQRLAEAGPRSLRGIDLTERAIEHTRARFEAFGLRSELAVGNAEALPFPDASFDFVYSWGVIHHSPDTPKAAQEILRVLRPGGVARVMIYHRRCPVGWMLWTRYALLRGKPWIGLDQVYARHLESPGTKAYDVAQARALFAGASAVATQVKPSMGDLLQGEVGQRHRGPLLTMAKLLWPRWLIKAVGRRYAFGMGLLIEVRR